MVATKKSDPGVWDTDDYNSGFTIDDKGTYLSGHTGSVAW